MIFVNGSAKVITKNQIIQEMNGAHKNNIKITIVKVSEVIIDWTK